MRAWKDLLVYLEEGAALDSALASAGLLAEHFGAHIVGLAVSPFRLPLELSQPSRLRDYGERNRERLERLQGRFEHALPHGRREWRSHDGLAEGGERLDVISRHARYADAVVMGQPDRPREEDDAAVDLPAQVAVASGRPVLVLPRDGWEGRPGRRALVGWNGSREAARAIADALPLLAGAEAVKVLVAGGGDADPGGDVGAWLSRHGVPVEVEQRERSREDPARILLDVAASDDADLVVMGAYGQSRMRELVLGGTTREMMHRMERPVLLAH
ncbi:MAG: universal stress protein [Arhodomonas sp.]|nr:universal stress protein [Arhodomonas sp.]